MPRERLPDRREAEVLTVERVRLDGGRERLVMTYGRDDAGAIREVFIDAGKPTSDSAFLARDAGLILSIALQHGVAIDELRHSVGRNSDGYPQTVIGLALDVLAEEEREMSGGLP